MNRRRIMLAGLLLAALVLGPGLAALAQEAGPAAPAAAYSLDRWTAGGGGGVSSGGIFTLSGTMGQPDAGALSGGVYTLVGGFWGSAGAINAATYLPLILR
jgi:hypothetical protein